MTDSEILSKLRVFVQEQAMLADKSYHEWETGSPGCQQAAYRSGMWYGFHEVENFIGKPDCPRTVNSSLATPIPPHAPKNLS